jgi:uncharacterized protein (TIGR04255 family)
LLGELASPDVAGEIQHAAREVVISLQDPDTQVRVRHGLARAPGNEEVCYVVDSDFSKDKPTEVKNVFDVLASFNKQAGRLFRWYITPELHLAMGPRESRQCPFP